MKYKKFNPMSESYIICIGEYTNYVPSDVDLKGKTFQIIRRDNEWSHYEYRYNNYYTICSLAEKELIFIIDECWILKDFRAITEDELIIKDILE
jgi:hypothetical protein